MHGCSRRHHQAALRAVGGEGELEDAATHRAAPRARRALSLLLHMGIPRTSARVAAKVGTEHARLGRIGEERGVAVEHARRGCAAPEIKPPLAAHSGELGARRRAHHRSARVQARRRERLLRGRRRLDSAEPARGGIDERSVLRGEQQRERSASRDGSAQWAHRTHRRWCVIGEALGAAVIIDAAVQRDGEGQRLEVAENERGRRLGDRGRAAEGGAGLVQLVHLPEHKLPAALWRREQVLQVRVRTSEIGDRRDVGYVGGGHYGLAEFAPVMGAVAEAGGAHGDQGVARGGTRRGHYSAGVPIELRRCEVAKADVVDPKVASVERHLERDALRHATRRRGAFEGLAIDPRGVGDITRLAAPPAPVGSALVEGGPVDKDGRPTVERTTRRAERVHRKQGEACGGCVLLSVECEAHGC